MNPYDENGETEKGRVRSLKGHGSQLMAEYTRAADALLSWTYGVKAADLSDPKIAQLYFAAKELLAL